MTIQINGSGSITGISVGGLQDGCVDAGDIAVGAVTPAKLSTGGPNWDSSGRLLVGTSSGTGQESKVVVTGRPGSATESTGFSAVTTSDSLSSNNTIGWMTFGSLAKYDAAGIAAFADAAWTAGTSRPTRLVFSTTADGASSPTERLRIDRDGRFSAFDIYASTTAGGANVNVNSSGRLQRSTSSAKYKTQIEDLQESYADAILGCRPVWYRSTCKADNPEHGWWGFIAEEVAEIDPRLVFWKTTEAVVQENGSIKHVPCDPEPEGVQYDRFVPHLINLIKRQKEQIETLETQNAQFEARLTALEGGTN